VLTSRAEELLLLRRLACCLLCACAAAQRPVMCGDSGSVAARVSLCHVTSRVSPVCQPVSRVSPVCQPVSRVSPVGQPVSRVSPVCQPVSACVSVTAMTVVDRVQCVSMWARPTPGQRITLFPCLCFDWMSACCVSWTPPVYADDTVVQ